MHPPLARVAVALGPFLAGHPMESAIGHVGGGQCDSCGPETISAQSRPCPRGRAALLRDLRVLDVVLGCDAIWRNGGGGSGAVFHDVSGDSRARGFGHHRYGRGRRIHGRSARLHYWLESPTNSRSALLGVTTAPGFALQIQRSRFLAQVGSRCVVWQGLLERGEHSVAPSFRRGRGLVVTPAAATLLCWDGFR